MGSCVSDLASRRRTIRKFSSDPVDMEKVLAALEVACQAPSGANRQPWRFVIVTDQAVKRQIREVCEQGERGFYTGVEGELRTWLLARGLSWRKPFLEAAPLLVLVLSEVEAPYSKESVWLAIGYALLAMEELGLSTITYTPSDAASALHAVEVPESFRLEAILPIGFSADEKPKEARRRVHEVAYINSWGHALKKRLSSGLRSERANTA